MTVALVGLVVLAAAPWIARRGARELRPDRTTGRRPRGSPLLPGRRRSAIEPRELDGALLLELVGAALGAGTPVPRALSTVGAALPGVDGAALVRAGAALALGSPPSVAFADAPTAVRALGAALEPTWTTGASPVPLLRAAAASARRRRRAAGRAAAGRVGVWLVLPLGLCFLPAFLLLGVVPVVLSIAGRLLG